MSVLEVKKLKQIFDEGTSNENQVLKGIDLTLEQGDFVVIIGGNGAGKSTFLNSIAGSLPISHGQVKVNNKNVTYQSVFKRSKLISRVFQDPRWGTASLLTVEENLSIALNRGKWRNFWSRGVRKQDRNKFKEQLKLLNLSLENRLQDDIGLLSGGQRQAITLLMATINKPSLLLLDEHTAALDPQTSQVVMDLTNKLVEEQKITTLMITHNMEDAIKYGNRLIMLNQGKIAFELSGKTKKELTVPKLMEIFKERMNQELNDDTLLLSK